MIVQTIDKGARVEHRLYRLTFHVHLNNDVIMGKQELRRTSILSHTTLMFRQRVARITATLVGLRQIETGLLTETPLGTLIPIYTGSAVVGNFLTFRTLTYTSSRTSLTCELTVEERTAFGGAHRLFISVILTVLPSVAHLRLRYTFRLPAGRAHRAQELVIRTRYTGAVGLVGSVYTVPITVTMVGDRDTQRVGALELAHVTRGEVALLLVTIVATVVVVITLQLGVDALLSVGAPELVEVTRQPGGRRTALFVLPVSTVVVAVAAFVLRDANAVRRVALEVPRRALPEITVSLIGAIDTVDDFITAEMLREAVGLVPDVLLTRQLPLFTFGGRTSLLLILPLVTVFMKVAHPQGGYAFAVQTSELTGRALCGRNCYALR